MSGEPTGFPMESDGQPAARIVAPPAPPVPESGLKVGRALFILVAFFVVQLLVGGAVGVVVGMYFES